MFEVQILIPVVDNDGNHFSADDHAAFEAFVLARFGGVTLFPNTAVGSWVDNGVVFRDDTRLYGVAVRSITNGDKIAEVVVFAKAHYRQLAIYIRYLGIVEIL